MSPPSLVDELSSDLGFGTEDMECLSRLRPLMTSELPAVVDRFYEVIAANPRMRAVFDDDAQIDRQKAHLLDWLEGVFSGTYDDAYWKHRERIGRTHVRIGLDQHYMVAMMGIIRTELDARLRSAAGAHDWSPERRRGCWSAITKLLDLELAVMLSTYEEAFVRRARAGERLATIGQVAATIGHELRNPLAVIDSSLALLRRRTPDEPRVAKHLDRIGEQVRIADGIITNLLAMVRDQPPVRVRVDLAAQLRDAWELLRDREGAVLETDLEVSEGWLDAGHIRQLVINLLQNAIDAGATRVRAVTRVRNGELELVIEDDGKGLPEDAEGWLFEPLATSRQQGSGLGLALCRRIVDKHDGSITAERLERGTRLRARFGAALEAPEAVQ